MVFEIHFLDTFIFRVLELQGESSYIFFFHRLDSSLTFSVCGCRLFFLSWLVNQLFPPSKATPPPEIAGVPYDQGLKEPLVDPFVFRGLSRPLFP